MADAKGKKLDPIKDLKWVLIILGGLFVLWYFTGGPQRLNQQQPFLAPPVPVSR